MLQISNNLKLVFCTWQWVYCTHYCHCYCHQISVQQSTFGVFALWIYSWQICRNCGPKPQIWALGTCLYIHLYTLILVKVKIETSRPVSVIFLVLRLDWYFWVMADYFIAHIDRSCTIVVHILNEITLHSKNSIVSHTQILSITLRVLKGCWLHPQHPSLFNPLSCWQCLMLVQGQVSVCVTIFAVFNRRGIHSIEEERLSISLL